MALIPAPPHVPERDTISVRLDRELHESLRLYAEFLHASKDYVVQAALRRVCDRDQDFLAWRRDRTVAASDPIETRASPAPTAARATRRQTPATSVGKDSNHA